MASLTDKAEVYFMKYLICQRRAFPDEYLCVFLAVMAPRRRPPPHSSITILGQRLEEAVRSQMDGTLTIKSRTRLGLCRETRLAVEENREGCLSGAEDQKRKQLFVLLLTALETRP